MAQEWLSLAEISRRTGIAESSLRRYVRNFASHLPQEQAGKRWVFAEEAVEVFERIGAAYREGKTTDEISLLLGEGSGAGSSSQSDFCLAFLAIGPTDGKRVREGVNVQNQQGS